MASISIADYRRQATQSERYETPHRQKLSFDPFGVDYRAPQNNEFIHKLCGYALRCLRGDTTAEQDASFVAAILDDLSQWLGEARNSN